MNKNHEEIRSEEERVESFMQALQRMHEDPAEAARIDMIIEDADPPADDINNQSQPLIVHIHNEGGSNIVNLPPADPNSTSTDPEPRTSPRQQIDQGRPRRFNWQPLTSIPALALMTVILVASMGYASPQIWSALAGASIAVTAAQIWLSERFNILDRQLEAQTAQLAIEEERTARELNKY